MDIQKIDKLNKEAIALMGMDKAPEGFTLRVMDQITREPLKIPVYAPLIRTKGWIFLAITLGLFIVVLWHASTLDQESVGLFTTIHLDSFSRKYVEPLTSAIVTQGSKYAIYVLGACAATVLLMIDRLFSESIRKLRIS